MSKECRDCGVKNNGSNFYDGRPRCKPCHNKAMGEYAKKRKSAHRRMERTIAWRPADVSIERAYTIITALRQSRTLDELLRVRAMVGQ